MGRLNVLFCSLYSFEELRHGYINTDLLIEFLKAGHNVVAVNPSADAERTGRIQVTEYAGEGLDAVSERFREESGYVPGGTFRHISIGAGQIQRTGLVRKVLNLRALDALCQKAIDKHCADVRFDIVVVMVTHCAFFKTVRALKKRDGAYVYFMVKDIFPQNAVDLELLRKGGLLHSYFRYRERKYYRISDKLGALSTSAVETVKRLHPFLKADKVEENPNSQYPVDQMLSIQQRQDVRNRYGLPQDKMVFVYGGNLGRPQGLDFLLDVAIKNESRSNSYIIIAGGGTEFERLANAVRGMNNTHLISSLPESVFSELCMASDASLVFLDKRFTVPSYPSRVLAYLNACLPVLYAVDTTTDAGVIAEQNGFGYNIITGDLTGFMDRLGELADNPEKAKEMGAKGKEYMRNHYSARRSYDIIINSYNNK